MTPRAIESGLRCLLRRRVCRAPVLSEQPLVIHAQRLSELDPTVVVLQIGICAVVE
jgi:hypothetical protein